MSKKNSQDNSGRLNPSTILLALFRRFVLTKRKLRELALENLQVSDKEIRAIGPILQRISWSNPETWKRIQTYGVNVLPINYYSNSPSFEEISSSFEYTESEPPYLSDRVFNPVLLTKTLQELTVYSGEFDPPRDGDDKFIYRFFWQNDQFSYSDAMAYYCFIRKLKPKNILEIGSGFSTLIAIEAMKRNETGTITCVEPFPKPFLERNPSVNLVKHKAQELTADFLNTTLQDGDILFIDSTHTVKTGSDCLHIYLRLLPEIKRNIFIHVHDVFLPFGLPKEWLLTKLFFWTEQYLLLALLIDNPKAKVLYGSSYHQKLNAAALSKLTGDKYPPGGGSLWFEYRGRLQWNTDE